MAIYKHFFVVVVDNILKKNEFKHVLIFSKQLNKSRTRYNQVVSNERDSAKPF